jgi:hypothetical protein
VWTRSTWIYTAQRSGTKAGDDTRCALPGQLDEIDPVSRAKRPMPPSPGPEPLTSFEGYGANVTLAGDGWAYGHTGGTEHGPEHLLEFYDSGYVTVFMSNYEMGSLRGIPGLARKLIAEQG